MNAIFELAYLARVRLSEKCNNALQLEGASTGANHDVRHAKMRRLKIFYSLEDIPVA
jgi:hypothetical protein